jgi:arsenite-transporting ATPase
VRARLAPNGQRRTVFFAGKGGVGKTVASCVTAVWLAHQGLKTLLLTTDPAAHLGDVLDSPVGDEVTPIPGQPDLWAVKIDPKAAAETYKARILDDARQRGRPESAIKVMEEELNSPCTEEMAAFDKFVEYASQEEWDSVIFDTAPTGHTLRLLELPVDWSKQIDVKVFASVDANAADDVAKQRFGKVIEMMSDPEQSTFAFVMYPEQRRFSKPGAPHRAWYSAFSQDWWLPTWSSRLSKPAHLLCNRAALCRRNISRKLLNGLRCPWCKFLCCHMRSKV